MGVDIAVSRVFTDANGDFGNPLGVVDAAHVAPTHRQRLAYELSYSETVFVKLPAAGSATARAAIYTPRRSGRSPATRPSGRHGGCGATASRSTHCGSRREYCR